MLGLALEFACALLLKEEVVASRTGVRVQPATEGEVATKPAGDRRRYPAGLGRTVRLEHADEAHEDALFCGPIDKRAIGDG